ncbi:unnamed protein product [Camellia sinensis]
MASSLPNCPLFVFAAKYLLKHGGQLCETEQFLQRESSFKSRCWVLSYSWIRGLLCYLHLLPESKDMQKAVAHLIYLLAITMVLNSVQPVISGENDAVR